MNSIVQEKYKSNTQALNKIITDFDDKGEQFVNGKRNTIKLFDLGDLKINIKSFKVPNIFNQLAYKHLRKSKAQRSFEYANILIDKGIKTPFPIAYYEFTTPLLFKRSFYVSEHLVYDLTYRELIHDFNYPDYDAILRAFTRFTFKLHNLDVNFLDHSPGNTLIKKVGDDYEFYLVDLNRMKFSPLTFEERIKNFARLTEHKSMVKTMSDEYAKCLNEDPEKVFNLMWSYTQEFQYKFNRKKELKKKFLFWR